MESTAITTREFKAAMDKYDHYDYNAAGHLDWPTNHPSQRALQFTSQMD